MVHISNHFPMFVQISFETHKNSVYVRFNLQIVQIEDTKQ
jgi:hypothetical protein